jgi:HEAT repeat protein
MFKTPSAPAQVTVNPEEQWLCDLTWEKPLAAWTAQLANGRSIVTRHRAAEALSAFGAEGVEALSAALRDPSPWVREAVAQSLANVKAWEPLRAALGDPDADVRRIAVNRLPAPQPKDTLALLADILLSDRSDQTRGAIARALVRLKADGAYDLLTPHLGTSSYKENLRYGVYDAFGALGDTRIVPTAMKDTVYGNNNPHDLRLAAMNCLAAFANHPEIGAQVTAWLQALVSDPYWRVRQRAIDAMRDLKRSEPRATIEAIAEKDPDPRVRGTARRYLDAIPAEPAPNPPPAQRGGGGRDAVPARARHYTTPGNYSPWPDGQ